MTIKFTKRFISFLIISFLLFVFIGQPALVLAQDSLSLSITPPLIKNSIEPGQIWKSSIKLVNNNSEELRAYVVIKDFVSGEEDGTAVFINKTDSEDQNYLLSSWIVINEGPYAVAAHSSEEIPFIIQVPEDAAPGGHYAAILTGTKPPEVATEGSSVRISAMLATLLLMSVSGETNEAGMIREFSTDKKFYTDSDVRFRVRFENQGNIHLQPQGEIRVYDMYNKEKDVIKINHSTEFGNVLPQSIRQWEFDWQGEDGLLATGRYRAELILTYGENGKTTTEQVNFFWIIKYKPILIILAVILFFILLLILYIRRSVRQAIKTTQEMAGRTSGRPITPGATGTPGQAVDLKSFLIKSNEDRGNRTGLKNWSFMKKFFVIVLSVLGIALIILGVVFFRSSKPAINEVPDRQTNEPAVTEDSGIVDMPDASTSPEQIDETIDDPNQEQGTSSPETSPEEVAESNNKKASVVVLNGSGLAGAATKVAELLEENGYLVVNTGNADSFDYQNTRIIFKKDFEKTAGEIRGLFNGEIELESAVEQAGDIVIIIGQSGL